ncbi:MAG: glycosyltransferase family 4 protein [Actinobacteria bacterium]|nr:glycosyltransferase family 4 protein [Actinomycetota bacterium]
MAADKKFKFLNHDANLLRIKRRYRLPDQFLLYVGDANWVKNLPFLIEGFKQLIQSVSFANLKLVLVGGVFLKNVENINHPELESLKLVNQLIKQYGLDKNIFRPGQIDDMELIAFYNLATAYVQPSIYEGFGLPILQALACGTPVISSNKASLVEVGGESVLYFDPTDLEQFKSVAGKLLKDKSLQGKLSGLGLKQATKFSWKKVAEDTELVYLKAVEKK